MHIRKELRLARDNEMRLAACNDEFVRKGHEVAAKQAITVKQNIHTHKTDKKPICVYTHVCMYVCMYVCM